MRVAVVTPYYKEPAEWLARCLQSVKDQTHEATHFLVSDGHPQDWLDGMGVRHVRLGKAHADYGNTPRTIGGLLAAAEGFDAIAFLDADNWFAPEHVALCVDAAADGKADYVTAMRWWARADGSVMDVRIDEDLDGSHVDTNCFFLLRGAFHTIPRWSLMPRPMAMWCDRFFLASLRAEGLIERGTNQKTVFYLCTWANVYQAIGEPPPPYAKGGLPVKELAAWYKGLTARDREHVLRQTGYEVPEYA
jgi:hypothetical protein